MQGLLLYLFLALTAVYFCILSQCGREDVKMSLQCKLGTSSMFYLHLSPLLKSTNSSDDAKYLALQGLKLVIAIHLFCRDGNSFCHHLTQKRQCFVSLFFELDWQCISKGRQPEHLAALSARLRGTPVQTA